jgi:hypothetical protein
MDPDDPTASKSPKTMFPQDPADPVPGLEKSPALTRSVQTQLGQRLRQFYETLALGEQPVPERFIEIINRLDQGRPEPKQS